VTRRLVERAFGRRGWMAIGNDMGLEFGPLE